MHWLLYSGFMVRSNCGPWKQWMVDLSTMSNAAIAVSYFIIAASVLRFYFHKRIVLPYAWVLPMFSGFIGLCGLTHVGDVLAFYWPAYRLFLTVDFATALMSVSTAIATPFAVRYLADWKPPEEYERLHERHERALDYIRKRRMADKGKSR